MKRIRNSICRFVLIAISIFSPLHALAIEGEDGTFFENNIRPLLIEHCHECHSNKSGKSKGGLLLDSRMALLQGGDSGPAVVPGDPDKSLLIQAIEHRDDVAGMPPKGKLAESKIAMLMSWVKSGASWPGEVMVETNSKGSSKTSDYTHWAWQPLTQTDLPSVRNTTWGSMPLDKFILEGLEANDLSPAPTASRRVLIRRLSFDLTGLPPTPEEVEAFCQDASIGAVEALVERLLSSPYFGERWGRHWLDVARYSDSIGGGMNYVLDDAWRYRDYVAASFNADKPYDRFVTEQIAGDLLPAKNYLERSEQLIATGFLMLGVNELGEYDREKLRMDIVDEQLDTLGKAFLGLTVGCARCHDHKFDPIPTHDYYAMAGILRSTNPLDETSAGLFGTLKRLPLPLDPANTEAVDIAKERLANLKKELAETQTAIKGDAKKKEVADPKVADERVKMLQNAVKEQQAIIDIKTSRALAVGEESQPTDSPILIRGDVHNRSDVVPRGYLTLVQINLAPSVNKQQSGRLELSQWLTHRDNPLLARVMVNRIWHWLMGVGLVRTVDNFGTRGEPPSHPALLDYLARRFIDSGWSVKAIVREIVLSQTYQQSGWPAEAAVKVDPDNRLQGRHDRRRLEAEEIHDALLAVSEALDNTIGGATNTRTGRLGTEGKDERVAFDPSRRRGFYQPIYRGGLAPDLFRVFDFPDAGLVTGSRNITTVAPQALFLLNSPIILEHAKRTADHLLVPSTTDIERLRILYHRLFGRAPSASEIERALNFIETSHDSSPNAWASLCHSLMISTSFLFVE